MSVFKYIIGAIIILLVSFAYNQDNPVRQIAVSSMVLFWLAMDSLVGAIKERK